ncbi:hypothetical protein KQI86_07320 [Clostridium sp. MSJ-11]|uniref:PCI domain-containing protein n=1 Tax=Clostridium mobile TaxID=2841512 RepID=A0ABS6EHF6_9CLOT|nr:hypothetical protein [Clostridium mobile]MBU5484136.1 hypothetical protein [Clostridium mobile]
MANNSIQAAISKDKIKIVFQSIIGWALAIMFGLMSLVGLTQIEEGIDVAVLIFCLALTIYGVSLIKKAKKRKNLIRLFKTYSARLASDPTKSIDLLATSTGVTVDVAKKNITEMINRGYFTNAYIDLNRNCLVFAGETQPVQQANTMKTPNNQPQQEYITVTCGGCGATNKVIKGTVGECEYCGTQISGK